MRRAAVVGAGLGGLSAAIHLRLAGHAVTVFEANARTGGRASRIEREGFCFDTGPSLLNYPWVFEQLFEAAGKRLSDYVELIPVDPSIEFRWPDGTRFQLSSDLKKLTAACERVEPGCGPALLAFLRDARAKYDTAFSKLVTRNEDNPLKWLAHLSVSELLGTAVWRSLDSELGRFFKIRYIREAFGSYGMYLGGSPYELPGLFTILAYGELAYGLWLPKGGIYSLVEAMETLALGTGVEICTSSPVERIETSADAVRGIVVRGELLPFDLVISNVDVPTTERDLVQPRPARPIRNRMTPGVLTFYWGIRGGFEHCGHHTIFLPHDYRRAFEQLTRGKRIPEELPFYVSVPSATDPSFAPPGDSAVFALVPTPVLSDVPDLDWDAASRAVRATILDRLALDPQRIVVEEVWTPLEWKRRFGLYDGSAFGAAHSLFQMGPFRARNYSSRTRGLFYVGAGTTPGTGMPMVVLGGKMVAERAASHAR